MKFGLKERDITHILCALKQFPEIEEALIFGSRATGSYKKGSDIDLAIKGKKISHRTLSRLNDLLEEELPIPYFFDVIDYKIAHSKQLLDHINHFGVKIFTKEL